MQRQPRSRIFNTLTDVYSVVSQPAAGQPAELLFLLLSGAGDRDAAELGRRELFGQSCGCSAVAVTSWLGLGVVVFLSSLLSQEKIGGGFRLGESEAVLCCHGLWILAGLRTQVFPEQGWPEESLKSLSAFSSYII